MNRLRASARTQVIACLLEGCSIRATVRMTGVSKKAVSKLLVDAGRVCTDYQDRVFRNLRCKRLQLDELWGFNYCKQKTVTPRSPRRLRELGTSGCGSRLMPTRSWYRRGCWEIAAWTRPSMFVDDLASRLTGRAQVTTDGHRPTWTR